MVSTGLSSISLTHSYAATRLTIQALWLTMWVVLVDNVRLKIDKVWVGFHD